MKNLTLIFAVSAFIIFFAGKDKKTNKEDKLNIKSVEKSLAKVTDKLYACEYEATNLEYRIFLNDLKATKQYEIYNQSRVDSTGWTDTNGRYYTNNSGKYTKENPLIKYYHSHEAYYYYPVVNITHKGAENFCKWLTEKYNSYSKRKYRKVIFRLPTEKEWIRAAEDSLLTSYTTAYPFDIEYQTFKYQYISPQCIVYDRKNNSYSVKFNIDTVKVKVKGPWRLSGMVFNGSDIPSIEPVLKKYKKYDKPNTLGIYNMLGNVAEMVKEEGVTKGGCWDSSGYYLNPFVVDEFRGFAGSSKYIGFRYFMEVIEQ